MQSWGLKLTKFEFGHGGFEFDYHYDTRSDTVHTISKAGSNMKDCYHRKHDHGTRQNEPNKKPVIVTCRPTCKNSPNLRWRPGSRHWLTLQRRRSRYFLQTERAQPWSKFDQLPLNSSLYILPVRSLSAAGTCEMLVQLQKSEQRGCEMHDSVCVHVTDIAKTSSKPA